MTSPDQIASFHPSALDSISEFLEGDWSDPFSLRCCEIPCVLRRHDVSPCLIAWDMECLECFAEQASLLGLELFFREDSLGPEVGELLDLRKAVNISLGRGDNSRRSRW